MSFRVRLAALIAAVFVVGGVALLGVQFLLVRHLLEQQVDETVVAMPVDITTGPVPSVPTTPEIMAGELLVTAFNGCPDGTVGRLVESDGESAWVECLSTEDGRATARIALNPALTPQAQAQVVERIIHESTTRTTTRVSDEVLHDLLVWSVAILAAFTALAVGAAWWLSRRSLGRVAAITAMTRTIGAEGLDRRLALTGPQDEIRELGDTIDSMLDRLEDAFERQDRFIAGASHELRTPLTTTRTLLEIPLEQGRVPSDLEPAVRGALDANQRSAHLVAALLTLARTRPGAPQAGGETDLAAQARTLLAERSAAAAARGLDVRRPAPDDVALAAVGTDIVLLAVGNLLDNAIRHNIDGGLLAVRTGTDTAGQVWVEVENDGSDLTGCDVEALKEPFHRGAASRLSGEGLGLGLALVEAAATSSGGTLTLAARPEGGLRARLTLALAAERVVRRDP